MTEQIRKNVFETNSSSSHSLTMSKGDIVAQPFANEILRKGEITLHKNEYGWEYFRYYDPIAKAEYLMTQMFTDDLPNGSPSSVVREMREDNMNFDMLCRVIEEHTGVKVVVEPGSSGYIDHQSEGRGLELFESEAGLRDFLFSRESYVQTGNDNSRPRRVIQTDRGDEEYYQASYREPKKAGVTVVLQAVHHWDFEELLTENGALISQKKNPEILEKLRAQGSVVLAHFDFRSGWAPFHYGEPQGDTMGELSSSKFSFSKKLKVTQKFEKISHKDEDESGYQHVFLHFSIPQALADEIAALKPPRKRKPAAKKAAAE